MIRAFFRFIGLVTGYPIQLIIFKRKTYYEDKKATHLMRGGKLLISNHFGVLDYVMEHFIVFPRKLNPVTAEFPFNHAIARFGMSFFGCIKCDRVTRSMKFMNECANVIKKGQLAIIYPEGHNTPDGEIKEFKLSYLVIAYRAGCPIVPMVTDGRYGLFKRAHVIVGKEIDVSQFFSTDKRTPPREQLEKANDYVYGRMLELKAELERRKTKKRREALTK